jgi:hypothetical protein
MTSLQALFGFRDARRPQRRRPSRRDLRAESLEPRALLAVTLPPSISSDTIEIDDNVVVGDVAAGGPAWAIAATGSGGPGYVQIFGNSRGRIDGAPGAANDDLSISAQTTVTVTGAIGATQRIDDLTIASETKQAVNLQQAVSLTGSLVVTQAGSVTVGGNVDVDDNLTITEASTVSFAGDVAVDGDLVITKATTVTFAGTLTVGGRLRIENASGAVRFLGEVTVGAAEVTSRDRVFVQGGFTSTGAAGSGDVTFTTDQVGFNSAVIATSAAVPTATLTIQPFTADRAIAIASPPGVAAGLAINDAALAAIQSGWKRVVFGRELDGTGAVTIGSIGSQQGFSQLLNTTTIVGGSIVVDDSVELVLPVDVTSQAAYLELVARAGGITVNAPINQTADERNAWVRLTAAGPIALNAPIWATDTVSLTTTGGGTITQQPTSAAAITAPKLVVVADGAVTLADSGNAFDTVAISTTNDAVVLREDSGYAIGTVTTTDAARGTPAVTVSGIAAGSGVVRLVTASGAKASTVSQTQSIVAAALGLEGTGTDWSLDLATNDIDTLAAKTGSVAFRDADDLTIGTVEAVAPLVELSGIDVARTVAVTAGTTLTILTAGDITAAATSGTAVDLSAMSGILTAGDVTTKGGDVFFRSSTTLTGDVVIDVVDAPATGTVTFASLVNGHDEGEQSLAVSGNLDAGGTIGAKTELKSLTVTDGTTSLRGGSVATSGVAGQSYGGPLQLFADTTLTGRVATGGTVTGDGKAVTIDGDATLGDAADDTVTGISSLTVTGDAVVNASKVAATVIQTWKKQVTLGADATFENGVIWFQGSIVGAGRDLTLTGSSVVLGDDPTDSVTGVDDLVVTGPAVLTGNTVGTTGTQTYDGGVTVTDATAVALTGKGFDFKRAIDRGDNNTPAPSLTITANGGGVKFGGDVATDGRPFGATDIRGQGRVSLAGTLWSNAAVKIASTQNAISGAAGNAIRTPGTIRLDAATGIGTRAVPIGIEAASVSAATSSGGIFLAAVEPTGNLWIGADGLVAPTGAIGLDARNVIGVYAGGRLRAGAGGVTASLPISWSIDVTADGGPGSLRQILLNLNEVGDANKAGLDARLMFDVPRVAILAPLVFRIATPLPEIRAAVAIVGFGVELEGTGMNATNGLVLGAAASGSTLQGLTLRGFREFGIQLRSAQGVTVDRVVVRSLNLSTSMGLYATGDLSRTRITGSEFTGGFRGMLLDGARNLRVGTTRAGEGNLFAENRAVPSRPTFAGTGIRAQGDSTGTVVEGNTFLGNNYGFGFVAARGLALRSNFFARSTIAGVHVEGNCTGSTQAGNTFATTLADRNRANVVRVRGAKGA